MLAVVPLAALIGAFAASAVTTRVLSQEPLVTRSQLSLLIQASVAEEGRLCFEIQKNRQLIDLLSEMVATAHGLNHVDLDAAPFNDSLCDGTQSNEWQQRLQRLIQP